MSQIPAFLRRLTFKPDAKTSLTVKAFGGALAGSGDNESSRCGGYRAGNRGVHLHLREFVPLSDYTTLGVGGPARFFVEVQTAVQVVSALDEAARRSLPVLVLGGGSNLVVSDQGFPGLVLQVGLRGIEFHNPEEIVASAGEDWDGFVRWCVERDLAGIENLSGIPGRVGGTPIQNVGAYGQEVAETIRSVCVLDRRTSQVLNLPTEECRFGYRRSRFNSEDRDRFVVLAVNFALRERGEPNLRYPDLAERLGVNSTSSLKEVRRAVLDVRASKAMVLDAQNPDSKSAGSFFRNVVLPPESVAALEERGRIAGCLDPAQSAPRYTVEGGQQKVPAAWLIERAGFHKGYRRGRAGISSRHTLALVNLGGATSADIVALMQEIQERVSAVFGVELQPEPVFVGFGRTGEPGVAL